MKRKAIEKIPSLPIEKANNKKRFVATAGIFELNGERNLIVDIFINLKRELKTPLIRICLTKTEYANYWPREKKWTQDAIDNVNVKDKVYMKEETVSIAEEQKIRINTELGYDTKHSWWWAIKQVQRMQNRKKYQKRLQIREEKLRKRITSMPEVPEDFYRWCENDLMKSCNYIFYKRKGRYTKFNCGCCGETYEYPVKRVETYEGQFEHIVEIPREGEQGICEKCGQKAWYKAAGRGTRINDKKQAYIIQKYGDNGAVVRYFEIYKCTEAKKIPVFEDIEISRSFFVPNMKKVQKDYQVVSGWDGAQLWLPNNIPGMYPIRVRAAKLYPGSLIEIKGTTLEYSAIEVWQKEHEQIEVVRYMEAYQKIPALEMIVKLGMTKMAEELVRDTWKGETILNLDGKDPASILMIDKAKIKQLAKTKGDAAMHEVLKEEHRRGISLKEEEEDQLALMRIKQEDLQTMLSCMTARKIINRVYKYSGVEQSGSLCGGAIQCLQAHAALYADYISMRFRMGYDMTNQLYLHPRNLMEEHNKLVIELDEKEGDKRIREAEKKFPEIRTMYETLREKYEYEDEKFRIRPANSAKEIVLEGRFQHHCVGGDTYLRSHQKGKSTILLLRQIESKDIPFVTVEVEGYKIRQWYGSYNKKTRQQEIDKWLHEYLELAKTGNLKHEITQTV